MYWKQQGARGKLKFQLVVAINNIKKYIEMVNKQEKVMDKIEKIIAFLKLPFRTLFTIAFIMGLILFLPDSLITRLQLNQFISEYGKFIGITFLISTAYLIVSLIIFVWNKVQLQIARIKFTSSISEVLDSLSFPDICLLREFVLQSKDVIEVPRENTEVISLYNKQIIVTASNTGRSFVFGHFISIELNPLVKKYITYDVLGLPKTTPTKDEIEEIKNNRPAFINNLNYVDNLINSLARF